MVSTMVHKTFLVTSFISAAPSPAFCFGLASENACHLLFYGKGILRLSSLFINLNKEKSPKLIACTWNKSEETERKKKLTCK